MAANPNDDVTSNTNVERRSDRELVVTRIVNAPAHIVFMAWSKPELFTRWWVPASSGVSMLSSEMDIRTGGTYRLVMRHPASGQPMAFFGRYLEVTPPARLVWTNDESDQGTITTVTLDDRGDQTLVRVSDLYPSKEALDEAMASGSTSGFTEQFEQLDALLASLTPTRSCPAAST